MGNRFLAMVLMLHSETIHDKLMYLQQCQEIQDCLYIREMSEMFYLALNDVSPKRKPSAYLLCCVFIVL